MTDPTPDQLRMTRRMAGLSQRRVAEILSVSAQTVGAWERGVRPMPAWQYSFLLWSIARL